MSRLGDIETSIRARLATATIGGSSAFAVVEGASGGNRPALRTALRRERTPAAYIAFIEESEGPEVRESARGARFAVLIADRTLRQASDPRHGDIDSAGAFALLHAARSRLDDYVTSAGFRLIPIHEKFLDADERIAVYELLYRVWPVAEDVTEYPTFGGSTIAGAASEMHVEVGELELIKIEMMSGGGGGQQTFGIAPRPIAFRGTLRAATHSALSAIERAIEALIIDQTVADIADGNGRTFEDCAIDAFERRGPRRIVGTNLEQPATIKFTQLTPDE